MNAWHNVFETHSTVEFYSFSCDESWLYLTVLFLVNLSSPLDTVVCPKVVVCFSKGNMNRVFFRRRHHLPDIGDGSSSIPNSSSSCPWHRFRKSRLWRRKQQAQMPLSSIHSSSCSSRAFCRSSSEFFPFPSH